MKLYHLIYKEIVGILSEEYNWEEVVILLIVIPIMAPIVVIYSLSIGLACLVKLTLDPKSYEPLGVTTQNAIIGLVLTIYACVGVVVIFGTYAVVVSLLEGFTG